MNFQLTSVSESAYSGNQPPELSLPAVTWSTVQGTPPGIPWRIFLSFLILFSETGTQTKSFSFINVAAKFTAAQWASREQRRANGGQHGHVNCSKCADSRHRYSKTVQLGRGFWGAAGNFLNDRRLQTAVNAQLCLLP